MQHAHGPVDPAGDSTTLPTHPTLLDPRDGTPLRAIGIVGGRIIWPQLGASDDDNGGGDSGAGGTDSGQQNDQDDDGDEDRSGTGQNADDDRDDSTGDGKRDSRNVKDLPSWAQRIIREARKQAGDERTKVAAAEKARQDQLDAIATALGLKKGEAVDPQKLAEQLTAERDKATKDAQDARTELAVFRAADKAKADPGALLDSREFMREVSELDSTSKDFATELDELIKQRVKDNPKRYGREPAKAPPAKSGPDGMTGGQGAPARTGSLYAAIEAATRRT